MHNMLDLMYQKRLFLIAVFGNFLFQLGLTYYVMSPIRQWYLFGFQIILIILLASARFYSILH